MPRVTIWDCIACPVQPHCSAYDPAGGWEHDEGVNPCVVVDEPDYILDGGEVREV